MLCRLHSGEKTELKAGCDAVLAAGKGESEGEDICKKRSGDKEVGLGSYLGKTKNSNCPVDADWPTVVL